MDFTQFENMVGVTFKDKGLLRQAFTHRSYLNENKAYHQGHNERLEYFGDAVLGFVVADYLFRRFPEMDEGKLTVLRAELVNWGTCAKVAESIGIGDLMLLSKGESKSTGRARQAMLANAFEAVIGAIYIDQGYETARTFILKLLEPLVDEIIKTDIWEKNPKNLLQEIAQSEMSVTPTYKTIREKGPDHDRQFVMGVYLNNELAGEGEGKSKQDAEQEAAKNALEAKGWSK